MDIAALTIAQALRDLRARKITSVELVTACLANIKKYNQRYNVFLTVVDEKNLLSQAAEIDKTDYSLPLSGIPLALKDLFSTAGLRTTAASWVLDNYIGAYDATVAARLKAAGAIIVGKLNQDAWAHGSSGENSDFGPTGNAFNPAYVAGGSSSGTAVSVALGMCLGATGTDTGGSIRVPASYNNLIGLKPTYGRVSRYGIVAMASSFDSIGHITKSVEDSAIILGVTAGQDPHDATTGTGAVPHYQKDLDRLNLKNLKIGVAEDYIVLGPQKTQGMNTGLEQAVEDALTVLTNQGATIVDVEMKYTQAALEAYYILTPSEVSSNLARYDGIRYGHGRDQFGPEAKRRIMIGTHALSSGYYDAYYRTAQQVRRLVCQDFDRAFAKVDLMFAPIIPTPPFPIGEKVNDPLALYLIDIYAVPVNLAGLPAVTLPAGFVGGLPVGAQLIGPQWSEPLLFQAAYQYEKATDWKEARPKALEK